MKTEEKIIAQTDEDRDGYWELMYRLEKGEKAVQKAALERQPDYAADYCTERERTDIVRSTLGALALYLGFGAEEALTQYTDSDISRGMGDMEALRKYAALLDDETERERLIATLAEVTLRWSIVCKARREERSLSGDE